MKTIHFFGCSFTAGHELPDDEILPWKKDCKTSEEYYNKLTSGYPSYHLPGSYEEYVDLCKSMAYPSIIETNQTEWTCINHAEFGSSIKQEIFKAVTLIENSAEPIDFIVFQIPHFSREFTFTNEEKLESFSINFPIVNSPDFNAYLEKSVVFHSINHWTFHGQLDLLMFEGYLLSKNIKFMFIELDDVNAYSKQPLGGIWNLRYTFVHSFEEQLRGLEYRLLGLHFNLLAHNEIANVLTDKIKERI